LKGPWDEMATTGLLGGDTAPAELEVYAHDLKDVKTEKIDIESKSVKDGIDLGTPELVTTRWEL
jgi:hypothetical protein